MSGDIFSVITGRGGATVVSWVEARDIAKHPAIPARKDLLEQELMSAEPPSLSLPRESNCACALPGRVLSARCAERVGVGMRCSGRQCLVRPGVQVS